MRYKDNSSFYVTFAVTNTITSQFEYFNSLEISIYNLSDEDYPEFTDGELTVELEKYLNDECTAKDCHVTILNWWLLKN